MKQLSKWEWPQEITLFGKRFKQSDFRPAIECGFNSENSAYLDFVVPVLGEKFPLAADPEVGYGRFALCLRGAPFLKEGDLIGFDFYFFNIYRDGESRHEEKRYDIAEMWPSSNFFALDEKAVEAFLQTVAVKYYNLVMPAVDPFFVFKNAFAIMDRTEWNTPGKRALSVLADICVKYDHLPVKYDENLARISATRLASFFAATGRLPTMQERASICGISGKADLGMGTERTWR